MKITFFNDKKNEYQLKKKLKLCFYKVLYIKIKQYLLYLRDIQNKTRYTKTKYHGKDITYNLIVNK